MAKRPKKAKRTKSKKKDSKLGREVEGLSLIALGLLILVSLSARAAQGEGNLLGPYFGEALSGFLAAISGPLPAFVLPFIIFAAGWKQFRGQLAPTSVRKMVFFSLLFVELCALLSINVVRLVPAPGMLLGGGGQVGGTIARFIFVPLFGHAAFGPYLVTLLGVLITVVWGAELRMNHFVELFNNAREFIRDLRTELGGRWAPVVPGKKSPKAKRDIRNSLEERDTVIRDEVRDRQTDERKRLEERQQEFIKEKSGVAPQIGASPESDPDKERKETSAEKRARLKAEEEQQRAQVELEQVPEPVEEISTEDAAPGQEPEEEESVLAEPSTKSIPVIAGVKQQRRQEVHYEEYEFPPLELLREPPPLSDSVSKEELLENSRVLEEKLNDFSVQGKVVQVSPGPIITRYEVELAPGIKVSKVQSLDNDLAMAMKALRVRILAPIPGKNAVGIELPNPKPATIYLREILGSDKFPGSKESLTLAIGKTIVHEPYVTDLTKMPHLLVAGQTGSGKSVCINSIISSILYSKSPEECRMIMIDPKVVELALYNDIPHLLSPVVTDVREAVKCLKWAVAEMERRYRLLAKVTVRNITGFNHKLENGLIKDGVLASDENQRLPYIIVIIDELADLMMTAANEVETHIVRIAQLARAVGIHLVVATQRPQANVITGLIKANMPSRIAFQVASKLDSRVILDQNGADKLLGRGDMLFIPPGVAEPVRLHGAFVADSETEALVEAVKSQKVRADRLEDWNTGQEDLAFEEEETAPSGGPTDATLFVEAAHLVVRHQLGSTSLLQRRLKVGYARAGRLMDELEEHGIVGPNNGSKAREVRVDEISLAEVLDRRKQAGRA